MIIINKPDSLYIAIEKNEEYLESTTYSIHKVDTSGCISEDAEAEGVIVSNFKKNFKLSDGTYILKVKDTNINDPKKNFCTEFKVFYNYLPVLLEYLKNMFCTKKCNPCCDKKELLEKYMEVMSYLACKNFLKDLILVKHTSCTFFEDIQEDKNYQKFLGKKVFNYEEKIKEFFLYLYLELFNTFSYTITDSNFTMEDKIKMFRLKELEVCFLKAGYDFSKLQCELDDFNLKCNCDE